MESIKDQLERVSEKMREEGNKGLLKFINQLRDEATRQVELLRVKIRVTYWLVVILTVVMFAIGVWLILIPSIGAFKVAMSMQAMDTATSVQQLIAAIAGLADLTVLFLAKPIRQIHNLMGDMTQLTIVLNSYRYQVGLRLLQMNSNDPESVGYTAEKIDEAAKSSVGLVESYFEKVEQ